MNREQAKILINNNLVAQEICILFPECRAENYDLVEAFAKGRAIKLCGSGIMNYSFCCPRSDYLIEPEMITLTITIPKPESQPLKDGARDKLKIWVMDALETFGYKEGWWTNDAQDLQNLNRGLTYLKESDAKLAAKGYGWVK